MHAKNMRRDAMKIPRLLIVIRMTLALMASFSVRVSASRHEAIKILSLLIAVTKNLASFVSFICARV